MIRRFPFFRSFSFSFIRCCSSSTTSNLGEKNKSLKLALADLESILGPTTNSPPAPPKKKQHATIISEEEDLKKKEQILNQKIAGREGEPIINKKDKILERVLLDHAFQNPMIYRSGEVCHPNNTIQNKNNLSEEEKRKIQSYAVESLAWDSTATIDDYRNLVRMLISLSRKEVWETVQKQCNDNTTSVSNQLAEVEKKLTEYRAIREEIRSLLKEFKSLTSPAENNNVTKVDNNQDLLPNFKLVSNYNSVVEIPVLSGKHYKEIPEDSTIIKVKWLTEGEENGIED